MGCMATNQRRSLIGVLVMDGGLEEGGLGRNLLVGGDVVLVLKLVCLNLICEAHYFKFKI